MTVGYVRGASSTSGGSSVSSKQSSYASNDVGNLLVGCFAWDDAFDTVSISSVTDTAGNVWVPSCTKRYSNPLGKSAQMYHVIGNVASAGTNTVTVTLSNSTTHVINAIIELNSDFGWWGAAEDTADQSVFSVGNNATPGPLGITPGDAICGFVSFCICADSKTVGGVAGDGYTERQPTSAAAYLVSTAETSTGVTRSCSQALSGSAQWMMLVSSYLGTGQAGMFVWTGTDWGRVVDLQQWSGAIWTTVASLNSWNGTAWINASY